MTRPSLGLALVILAAALPPALASPEPLEHRTILVTGDPVPGEPGGVTFVWIGAAPAIGNDIPPLIDGQGNVGFTAGWGSSFIDPHGVLRDVDGILEVIARRGDIAPGVDVPFDLFPAIVPNPPRMSGGRSSFDGLVTIDGPQRTGIWTDRSGALELAVLQTDHPPGAPDGYFFTSWFHTLIGDQILLIGGWGGSLNDQGIWREAGNGLEAIVVAGDEAPGTGGAVFGNETPYAFPAFMQWDAADDGRIVFHAMLTGTMEGQDEGVWVERETGIDMLAREGDPAPGDPGARYLGNAGFRTFGHDNGVALFRSGSGHVLFGAQTDVPGNSYPGSGVYTNRSGVVERVVLGRPAAESPPGDHAPGFPQGVSITTFLNAGITDAGLVAYNAVTSSASVGIWWDKNGEQELVMARGDGALGLPGGWTIDIPILLRFVDPGYMLVSCSFNTGDTGVLLVDPDGDAHLVAATSLPYEVRPGDFRTIGHIARSPQIGDQGEVPLELDFTDGSEALIVARPSETSSTEDPSVASGRLRLVASPNPLRSTSIITVDLVEPGDVDLAVYDATGRRLRTLTSGTLPAGRLAARWDGRDGAGRVLPSGMYFVRLGFDGESSGVRKVLLAR